MQRSARLATFFRSRTRQLVWAFSLALLGVAMLVGAYLTADFTRDVLINLGASVVMVGLTFVVFDPIFEDMRSNAVQEHRDRFLIGMGDALGRGVHFPGPPCWRCRSTCSATSRSRGRCWRPRPGPAPTCWS